MQKRFRLSNSKIQLSDGSKDTEITGINQHMEAHAILSAAKERATEIVHKAEQSYEKSKQKGYKDGLEAGRLENMEKIMETILSSVEFIENIEKTLIEVVSMAVKKVIGDFDEDERIVRIVRNALIHVRNQQKILIRVAVSDEKAVTSALAVMIQGKTSSTSYLDVVADPRLAAGSCIFESELGVVDASLATQLKAFDNAFRAKINN